MPHDRHPGTHDVPDDLLVTVHPFELHGLCPARRQRTHCRHRAGDALPIRQERQIGDQELLPDSSGDGAGVHGHQSYGGCDRRRVTMHHHGGGISDEHGIDV